MATGREPLEPSFAYIVDDYLGHDAPRRVARAQEKDIEDFVTSHEAVPRVHRNWRTAHSARSGIDEPTPERKSAALGALALQLRLWRALCRAALALAAVLGQIAEQTIHLLVVGG